jgi:hypothetical protein
MIIDVQKKSLASYPGEAQCLTLDCDSFSAQSSTGPPERDDDAGGGDGAALP